MISNLVSLREIRQPISILAYVNFDFEMWELDYLSIDMHLIMKSATMLFPSVITERQKIIVAKRSKRQRPHEGLQIKPQYKKNAFFELLTKQELNLLKNLAPNGTGIKKL